MSAFTQLTSRTVVLSERNIDTDQIIPARFLTTTLRQGLGKHAFSDWRTLPDGSTNLAFPFNLAENAAAQILVAGRNFGCGSSREHAPWALLELGLRAVISSEIVVSTPMVIRWAATTTFSLTCSPESRRCTATADITSAVVMAASSTRAR